MPTSCQSSWQRPTDQFTIVAMRMVAKGYISYQAIFPVEFWSALRDCPQNKTLGVYQAFKTGRAATVVRQKSFHTVDR